jgi:hypothetical protein
VKDAFKKLLTIGLGQHNTSGVFMELKGRKLATDFFFFFLSDD